MKASTQEQSALITNNELEKVETLINMAQANLSLLMASGQNKSFLVGHETVINSIWSVHDLLEQVKADSDNLRYT